MSIQERLFQRFGTADKYAACQFVVERHFPEVPGSSDRIDVLKLAASSGLEVEMCSTSQFDGKIQWNSDGKAKLSVSTLGGSTRRRFTIAHEIGHFLLRKELLDEGTSTSFRGVSSNRSQVKEEEELANLLAAEILMPAMAIRRALTDQSISLSKLQSLARRFDVSQMALLRRAADISGQQFLFLNVVPKFFSDYSSPAEVDDALFLVPHVGVKMDREKTRILGSVPFSELKKNTTVQVKLDSSFGVFDVLFEVAFRDRPIPNADLFAVVAGPAESDF